MIILTVMLVQPWYSTRERNKQHIHCLKLERAIFILPRQGEIPEDIHSCLLWGCVFTARNPKCESPEGRLLVGRAASLQGRGEGRGFPQQSWNTAAKNGIFLQLTEAKDTLRSI